MDRSHNLTVLVLALVAVSLFLPGAANSAEEFAKMRDRYQLEEETKLVAASSKQHVELLDLLRQRKVPELRDYKFKIERDLKKPILAEDVYYDSKDGILRKNGHSYRLRLNIHAHLQFKGFVSIKEGVAVRNEFETRLPVDVTKELMNQAADWVSGARRSQACDALSKQLGHKLEVEPVLTLASRRAEVLVFPSGGRFANDCEYFADIFLDEMTATRQGKSATFYIFEIELNDAPDVPDSQKQRFEAESRKAALALTRFLETDPRFHFTKATKNKYQMSWEALGEK